MMPQDHIVESLRRELVIVTEQLRSTREERNQFASDALHWRSQCYETYQRQQQQQQQRDYTKYNNNNYDTYDNDEQDYNQHNERPRQVEQAMHLVTRRKETTHPPSPAECMLDWEFGEGPTDSEGNALTDAAAVGSVFRVSNLFPYHYVPPLEFLPPLFVEEHLDVIAIIDRYAQLFHKRHVGCGDPSQVAPAVRVSEETFLSSQLRLAEEKVRQLEIALEEKNSQVVNLNKKLGLLAHRFAADLDDGAISGLESSIAQQPVMVPSPAPRVAAAPATSTPPPLRGATAPNNTNNTNTAAAGVAPPLLTDGASSRRGYTSDGDSPPPMPLSLKRSPPSAKRNLGNKSKQQQLSPTTSVKEVDRSPPRYRNNGPSSSTTNPRVAPHTAVLRPPPVPALLRHPQPAAGSVPPTSSFFDPLSSGAPPFNNSDTRSIVSNASQVAPVVASPFPQPDRILLGGRSATQQHPFDPNNNLYNSHQYHHSLVPPAMASPPPSSLGYSSYYPQRPVSPWSSLVN